MFTIPTAQSSEHGHEQIYGDPTVTASATVDPTRNLSRVEQQIDSSLAEFFFIGVALSIITLVTVMGNSLVIIAVCVVKKLRQPSNYLLVSLAVADLSVALGVMPFAILTDLKGGKWIFDEVFCNIFIGMDVMCCTASILTLCAISIDRYVHAIHLKCRTFMHTISFKHKFSCDIRIESPSFSSVYIEYKRFIV